MGESQSRYSIVERLTQKKLNIMSKKADLKDDLKRKEQRLEELKKDFANWSTDIEEDIKRIRREREREIEKVHEECENASKAMPEKAAAHDTEIAAIEDALKSIEDISRTSPTQGS